MKALARFGDFLVATCIFTAFCALGLCLATERLLFPEMLPLTDSLHLMVFGSTLVVYNLPRMLPRVYGSPRPRHPLRPWFFVFFAAGIIIMLPGVLHLGKDILVVGTVLGLLAFSYFLPSLPSRRRLRDYGIVKIVVLTAVWTVATAVLPMMYVNVAVSNYPFELLLRFVFVFALCVLFDIRDMELDSSRNIRTLPNRIGMKSAYILVHISLVVFVALSVMQHLRHPHLGRLIAAIITAIVTALVAEYVRRHPGHKAFVAMTDGMMLLYSVLVLVTN
ncbi:MAG: UbiA family prenyltransferase [Taibaiella sp.]|nr:UbiA family prenyltransferase [Taibaiella sp.]